MKAAYEGTLSDNRKARFHYELVKEYEAGLKLAGHEVKALRTHRVQMSGTFVTVTPSGEVIWKSVQLPGYAPARVPQTTRDILLLITREQREDLRKHLAEKGLTIVPLQVYCKGRYLKLRIALAKGRKKHDKRAVIKARDLDREARREKTG